MVPLFDIEQGSVFDYEQDGEDMTAGREHAERRAAQAAAARKHRNRKRVVKLPGKGERNNWKKEV